MLRQKFLRNSYCSKKHFLLQPLQVIYCTSAYKKQLATNVNGISDKKNIPKGKKVFLSRINHTILRHFENVPRLWEIIQYQC